ncbi:hypothetical protein E2C01_006758 [Portunus trituberculatus]|uniref:Uncharacterized protein n=1 Tax=Portunus trituberculatus TaxID=210409 RepID=A0A5B7CY69_PORTR|nr:hypothetical protein [Portunus trituberculatus]
MVEQLKSHGKQGNIARTSLHYAYNPLESKTMKSGRLNNILENRRSETAGEDKMAGQIVARVRPPPPLTQHSRHHSSRPFSFDYLPNGF